MQAPPVTWRGPALFLLGAPSVPRAFQPPLCKPAARPVARAPHRPHCTKPRARQPQASGHGGAACLPCAHSQCKAPIVPRLEVRHLLWGKAVGAQTPMGGWVEWVAGGRVDGPKTAGCAGLHTLAVALDPSRRCGTPKDKLGAPTYVPLLPKPASTAIQATTLTVVPLPRGPASQDDARPPVPVFGLPFMPRGVCCARAFAPPLHWCCARRRSS